MSHASPRLLPAGRQARDDESLLRRRALAVVKHSARSVVCAPPDQRRIVPIFGCPRSVTTILQRVLFHRAWRAFILEGAIEPMGATEPGKAIWTLRLYPRIGMRFPGAR